MQRNEETQRNDDVICPRLSSPVEPDSQAADGLQSSFRVGNPKVTEHIRTPQLLEIQNTRERVPSYPTQSPNDSKSSIELVNSVMVPPAINELLRFSFLTGRGFRKTHPLWTDFEPTKTFILEIKGVAIEVPRAFTETSDRQIVQ